MQIIRYAKNKYSGFNFTYFYSENGLVFTTFREDIFEEFFRFYPKKEVAFYKEENKEIKIKLSEYFENGKEISEKRIDWKFIGAKKTLKLVLNELVDLKTMINYQELANRIDQPKAVRAVGTAVGKNPLEVIIPCHRVIKKDGKIGNYRDGVMIKEKLIELEKQIV